MSKLNISSNCITGLHQESAESQFLGYDSTHGRGLTALSKLTSNLTELDISNNCLTIYEVRLLAPALQALASLDISNNSLGSEGAKVLASALKVCFL